LARTAALAGPERRHVERSIVDHGLGL
jgi:hypothetical protein